MIHDIILYLLDPKLNNIAIAECIHISEYHLHPSEIQLLKEILKSAEIHERIRAFIIKHSSSVFTIPTDDKTKKSRGLYLEAFANALDTSLYQFRTKIIELEKEYIKNVHLPINYFLTEINQFQTLFQFLKELINEIETQQLYGCAFLSLMHKYSHQADPKSMQALKTIRLGVYMVFLRQLTQWLIYGQLIDIHGEFFIRLDNFNENVVTDAMTTTANTLLSDKISNNNSELWQYKIVYGMIPNQFTTSWAENVLFIGQTVRILVDDPRNTTKKVSIWNDEDVDLAVAESGLLWNNKEHTFFNKIQKLYNSSSIDNGSHESVINDIKIYVTERLSEIAFNQADLMQHLKLFKEYYLLGRGELFLEFIIQLNTIEKRSGNTENLAREVNQAFQKALSRTSIDADQISISFIHESADFETNDQMQTILHSIRLNFNVMWPLHLIFSSRVLDQYNELFRFLLQIRQLQNGLHSVWWLHRENKIAGYSILTQLRNKMLFIIDNLQYYLQVDVLESHFSILLNAIQTSKDFEYITRAHKIFQANVMSLSFLLNKTDACNDTSYGDFPHQSENPVLSILNKIFQTIRSFCNFNEGAEDRKSLYAEQFAEVLDGHYSNHMKELLQLLSNRMAGPNSEPLSQLLLRLDFNHWFSSSCTD